MRFPIRYQFMLPLLGVAVISLLAIATIHASLTTRQIKERIERQLQGVVTVLSESSYPLTDTVLKQMGGLANAQFLLTDMTGSLIANGSSISIKQLKAIEQTSSDIQSVKLGPEIEIEAQRYFYSSVRVQRAAPSAKPRVLHILFGQEEFNAAWRAAFLPPLWIGLGTVLAIALLIHLIARRLAKVLSYFGKEVTKLSVGEFSELSLPEWNDETSDLAKAINLTAVRLRKYEEGLLRTERVHTVAMLGAGLAHEMRNAATGCRLAVDLHAESCSSSSEDDGLDVARQQLKLMESRLKQLLHLGSHSEQTNSQVVDLTALTKGLIEQVRPNAKHADIAIKWEDSPQPVHVKTDPELLKQAIMNVLLNAIEAVSKRKSSQNKSPQSDQQYHVRVKLMALSNTAELTIIDSGDGPDSSQIENVFELFASSKAEGVGIGLAVTKQVLAAFDGKIDWHRENACTHFCIRMPSLAVEE